MNNKKFLFGGSLALILITASAGLPLVGGGRVCWVSTSHLGPDPFSSASLLSERLPV